MVPSPLGMILRPHGIVASPHGIVASPLEVVPHPLEMILLTSSLFLPPWESSPAHKHPPRYLKLFMSTPPIPGGKKPAPAGLIKGCPPTTAPNREYVQASLNQ